MINFSSLAVYSVLKSESKEIKNRACFLIFYEKNYYELKN